MDTNSNPISRRRLLKGSLAAAAAVPLAACAGSGSGSNNKNNHTASTTDNPFGLNKSSPIDAVIFNGGYGYDYVTFAGKELNKKFANVKVGIHPTTTISQQLQPRFVGGNPPDLIDNSGANQIGFNSILTQLETLDDVFEANNYEGTKISDTIYPNVKEPGTFGGKFVAVNYAMTVYAVWYSGSLFEQYGWQPPKTWDDVLDLGAKAKAKGKYLWVWGVEAATYYQTLAMDSAIKEGGDEVNVALGNLEPNGWSHPAIQKVFAALETCVKKGYFIPGGAGTQFTKAQAKWSLNEQAVLYPSGGWIENEMKKATKDGFKMMGAPIPTVTSSSKMPYEAIRSAAGEPYIVPSEGKNTAGGKELLRAMLSKDAATNFSKTRLAPTIVKGLIPTDAFGSTALASQSKMLEDAGSNTFDYEYFSLYGTNTDQLTVWNSFLSGKIDAGGLTKGLQQISDKVRKDPSVKKIKVTH
jgi:N-acetylglucosamine transport system substrate-binding protein